MSARSVRLALIFVAVALGLASPDSVLAEPTCPDLDYHNPQHHEKMDELARRARLNNASWNRYHESVVSALCAGKREGVDKLVDQGFVPASEAERIAAVLDKAYKSKRRSEVGRKYGSSKNRFVEMGACSACADNIAQYYTRRPESRCGTLAQRALGGDAAAVEQLVEFPAYCRWNYGNPGSSAHSSSKP
jgi:hypothetical protein